ncbi:hypothetical protein ACP70R_042189 [Stipagrostis hirtigluma subsp. patula]
MGACATKPKTLEGKAPEEVTVSTPKVAPAETTVSTEVAANQITEKVVEEAKEVPALVAAAVPPVNAEPEEKAEASSKSMIEINHKVEEVEEKIIEEEKPVAPVEENTAKVEEEPTEVAKNAEEEKEKPTQS